MIVGIHQPNYIPWMGYFQKIAMSHRFVFLDDVQYGKNSFTNRNRIKSDTGARWLTIPVRTSGHFCDNICSIEPVWDSGWRERHLAIVSQYYRKAPYFSAVRTLLEKTFGEMTTADSLAAVNEPIIRSVCGYLGLRAEFVRSSGLGCPGTATERLVNICRHLRATMYIAGSGAANYQEDGLFGEVGISVEHVSFGVAPYQQLWGDYIPNLSVLDVLMNCGPKTTLELIEQSLPTLGAAKRDA